MAVFSLGAVSNLAGTTILSTSVELRVTNTTAAPLTPIIVNAYSAPGGAPGGAVETLYFTTTFALGAPNAVVILNIPTTVPAYEIRVSSPAAAGFISDISLYAQGKDSAGNFVPVHAFPFGDWNIVTTE
ncbi:hypothetical protein [Paenibacillus sp. GP183]|uniref:hypothetical protein n=1 Tax=Paenibacillus sp. GP183 TaxID=1882751 RepID=UPI00089754F4|nr:hypothetical protein [Paenibacillus sp. GP183]SEB51035.1 hypothetical protein SAMN05443246_0779 [Paenibacillus sp. GP183]